MTEDPRLPFELPAVSRQKGTAGFAGGSISSDGGPALLRGAERRPGLAGALAGSIREWRGPARTIYTLPAMLRFRMGACTPTQGCHQRRAPRTIRQCSGPSSKASSRQAPSRLTVVAAATCQCVPMRHDRASLASPIPA